MVGIYYNDSLHKQIKHLKPAAEHPNTMTVS